MDFALLVLAAGQGTRMRSDLPKPLHRVGGAPMLHHAMRAGAALAPARTVVVTGHGAAAVAAAARALDPRAATPEQAERLGTAHAVLQAAPALEGFEGDAVVLYADTPLIRPETLLRMAERRRRGAGIVVLGFEAADPGRYGRLIVAPEGRGGVAPEGRGGAAPEGGEDAGGDRLERIAEWKDASEAERAVTLCNSGVMMADAALLLELAGEVGAENASGEYYLTDVVRLAAARGIGAAVVRCPEGETAGVNSRAELAAAEAAFQARARAAALEAGVTMTDPGSVFLSWDSALAADVTLEPHVVIGPGVTVEAGAAIRAFSHLEGCHVGPGCTVGPHARLRPGARLARDARVGNFVEVKNADLGAGAKVPHLSYVGDAEVGAGANLGAGTVTCNYDGVSKHRTVIGAGAFVGSSTMLVAPVRVGAEAVTGSGSVITEDVPDGALAIGRGRQVNKPGLGARMMARLRDLKDGR